MKLKLLMYARFAEQLSENVGCGTVTAAVALFASVFWAISLGQVTVGLSLSSTVTVKEQVAVLLCPSVAVKVTVVVPCGYVSEASAELLKSFVSVGGPEHASDAVGAVMVRAAVHTPASVSLVLLAGQVMVGGSDSVMVTSKEQVVVFPLSSVAVKVTVVVPTE